MNVIITGVYSDSMPRGILPSSSPSHTHTHREKWKHTPLSNLTGFADALKQQFWEADNQIEYEWPELKFYSQTNRHRSTPLNVTQGRRSEDYLKEECSARPALGAVGRTEGLSCLCDRGGYQTQTARIGLAPYFTATRLSWLIWDP